MGLFSLELKNGAPWGEAQQNEKTKLIGAWFFYFRFNF
jgi:hypothetical protein